MSQRKSNKLFCLLVLAAMILTAPLGFVEARAQEFPTKTIRLVLPFSPGGSADRMARLISQWLNDHWKQPVVVETRLGATGMLGAELVANSAADGYTVLFTSTGLVQAPVMNKAPYDIDRDFAPITQLAGLSVVLVVNSDSPIKSLDDYLAAARKPGASVSYGSFGIGSSLHVYGESLARDAKANLVHVPYRGEAPVLTDIIGGHLDSSFLSVTLTLEFIRSGKVRPLGVIGHKRYSVLPDVPTFVELGYPKLDALGWYGLLLPKGTPDSIVQKYYGEIKAMFADPQMIAQIKEMGLEPVASNPSEFSQFLKADAILWRKLITEAGLAVTPAN